MTQPAQHLAIVSGHNVFHRLHGDFDRSAPADASNAGTIDSFDLPATGVEEVPIAWRMPAHVFRARLAACSLTHTQRNAVAARTRFYSMPWLIPAGQDTDQLP